MVAQILAFLNATGQTALLKRVDSTRVRYMSVSIPIPTPVARQKYVLPYSKTLDEALILDIHVPNVTDPASQRDKEGAALPRLMNAYLTVQHNQERVLDQLPLTMLQQATWDGTRLAPGGKTQFAPLGPLRIDTQNNTWVEFSDIAGVAAGNAVPLVFAYFAAKAC